MGDILVVEDDPDVGLLVRHQFEAYGRDVLTVTSNYRDLLTEIRAGVYSDLDIVLLDFLLAPPVTGDVVARALREHTSAYVVGMSALLPMGRMITAFDHRTLCRNHPGWASFVMNCHEVWGKPLPMSRLREVLSLTTVA